MASRLALRPLTRVRLTTRLTPTHIASRSIASKSAPALAAAAKQRGTSPKIASTPARGASTAAEIEAELAAEAAGENGARAAAVEIEPLDLPLGVNGPADTATDWSRSYHGLSTQPFPKEAADILLAPIEPRDVEMKPDGIIYLPEIKYRRILNRAFGPGGWGLAPRSETNVGPTVVSREYALVCLGRLVAIARGEQEYFDPSGIPTATEACKSNALMRCCKDLGIASELWDPRFIRDFKANYCVEVFAENVNNKRKKKLWRRKDQPKLEYPWKEQ